MQEKKYIYLEEKGRLIRPEEGENTHTALQWDTACVHHFRMWASTAEKLNEELSPGFGS